MHSMGSSSGAVAASRAQVSSSTTRLVGLLPIGLYSTVSALVRSLLLYVLLQSVTCSSYPLSRVPSSSRCLSRCLLLGARYAYYDVTTCQTICGIRDRGQMAMEEDAAPSATSAEVEVPSSAESPVGRILAILEEMEPGPSEAMSAAAECDHGKWDLRYEKKTEYKQLTLPAVQVQKRRWGSTIGPCISAHCSGQTGASRAACIVKMCNRRRRSRYR